MRPAQAARSQRKAGLGVDDPWRVSERRGPFVERHSREKNSWCRSNWEVALGEDREQVISYLEVPVVSGNDDVFLRHSPTSRQASSSASKATSLRTEANGHSHAKRPYNTRLRYNTLRYCSFSHTPVCRCGCVCSPSLADRTTPGGCSRRRAHETSKTRRQTTARKIQAKTRLPHMRERGSGRESIR